jgi:hypothetical protein
MKIAKLLVANLVSIAMMAAPTLAVAQTKTTANPAAALSPSKIRVQSKGRHKSRQASGNLDGVEESSADRSFCAAGNTAYCRSQGLGIALAVAGVGGAIAALVAGTSGSNSPASR